MLTVSYSQGLGAPGVTPVALMQRALRSIAFKLQDSKYDPQVYDGTMTLGTLIALANVVPKVGQAARLPSAVTKATDLVGLFKKVISPLPYGSTVMEIILSPWLIDTVYKAVIAIVRAVPGAGGVATAIDTGVKTAKSAVATAAPAIAAGLELASRTFIAKPKDLPASAPSLDGVLGIPLAPGSGLRLYHSAIHGPLWTPSGWRDIGLGAAATVREHRGWPKGKPIRPEDWSPERTFSGKATLADLAKVDQDRWRNAKKKYKGLLAKLFDVGAVAFYTFESKGRRMGAFLDTKKGEMRILPMPKKKSKNLFQKFGSAAADFAGDLYDKGGDVLEKLVPDAVERAAADGWDWVKDNWDDALEAIRKYGCMIVNNDIVVGVVATGAGIVASPATSAAIVSGAAAGRTACAAIDVAEAVYLISKLLSTPKGGAKPLDSEAPPGEAPTQVMQTATKPLTPLLNIPGAATIPPGRVPGQTQRAGLVLITGKRPIQGQLILPLPEPIQPPRFDLPSARIYQAFDRATSTWIVVRI